MQRLLILGGLAVIGVVAYLKYAPETADTTPTTRTEAPAITATRDAGTIIGYNSGVAMNQSGEMVPPEVQGYYFIEILDDASDADYINEVQALMGRAHEDSDYLGIIGRDAARLRRIVLRSLDPLAPGSLSEATIIVIGRAQDESALRPAVEASGAELRFGIYIPPNTPVL